MSGHEQERLSAYLDDALSPGERAQVAAHLDACAECAARLAELAAVDGAVASLPYQAPPGYFEALPARVRARLGPRATARRLPVWTWAAAAALLLAVVTPLTLLTRPDGGSGAAARGIPAAAPPTLAAPQASSESAARKMERNEPKGEALPQRPMLASPVPKKRESGFASAPSEADASVAQQKAAPAAAPGAPPAPALAAREEKRRAVRAAAMSEAVTSERRNQAKASGDRTASPEGSRDAAAASGLDEPRLTRGRFAGGVGGSVSPTLVAAEADWRRLDAARPHTPAEWRRLREDWRRFVARDPAGPQADEARVRIVEAGREAWRASSEAADEAVFRKDAADYLERDDAAQKERVRELLR
jgi:anti-sigma factor RsiW